MLFVLVIICCHPLVTLKSHHGLEEQPRILDPVTVLTVTNVSFIPICLIFPMLLALVDCYFFIALHFISCVVLYCCTVHYSLLSSYF